MDIKKEINDILFGFQGGYVDVGGASDRLLHLLESDSLRYSEREIDFAYLAGVFNVSGIDGLHKEIERLKGIGKNPHDIIIAARG
jgi:hypothetical protein